MVKYLLLSLMLFTLLPQNRPIHAQSGGTAQDIITAVNQYRAGQGKPPLTVDPALMTAAQRHADWMAANHATSHVGAGGSMPNDRAAAAGYGGEARENIAWGTSNYITASFVVDTIWGESMGHRLTMLADAQHIGAGTASDDEMQYYVLLIGSPSYASFAPLDATMVSAQGGQPLPPIPSSSGTPVPPGKLAPTGTLVPTGTPAPTPYYVEPIQVATPGPDGTVIHIVGQGQTAWAIAAVYGVDLDDLLALNGLKRPVYLHPGDELIIRLGPNATPPPHDITHVVQPGESAWSVAALYGITLDELLEANDLQRPAIIQPGDVLVIPRSTTAEE